MGEAFVPLEPSLPPSIVPLVAPTDCVSAAPGGPGGTFPQHAHARVRAPAPAARGAARGRGRRPRPSRSRDRSRATSLPARLSLAGQPARVALQ